MICLIRYFIIYALAVSAYVACSVRVAAADDVKALNDSLMNVLTRSIEHRDEYLGKKAEQIAPLKQKYRAAADDAERFDIMGHIFDLYVSYNTDSAFVMAQKRMELARAIGDPIKIVNARLNFAGLYAATSSYYEALEIVKTVNSSDLPDWLLPYYYHINRTVYGQLADYAIFEKDIAEYERLTDCYRDSLLSVMNPASGTYAMVRCDQLNAHHKYKEALEVMLNYLRDHEAEAHDSAVYAYTMSASYEGLGMVDEQKTQLLISSIADMRSGFREYMSMRKLACMLYREGDVESAYRLMRICIADAVASNARLRVLEINQMFPVINEMYIKNLNEQQKQLRIMLMALIALLVCLGVTIYYVYKLMIRAREARRATLEANERLTELNHELTDYIDKLNRANEDIAENSYLKNEYIGRYMDQCVEYIERMDLMRKKMRKLVTSGNLAELNKQLGSDSYLDSELKLFYRNFDQTFLKIFPSFIEDFNKLLVPEGRIYPKSEGALNTELRVFALIRLGISDSAKIAHFLRYSVSTIYNYRTKVRNKALCDRDRLEAEVLNIG
ncbi:MAG: DUF6377 domain-containing protein, partial [Muribaculaceae bacterium]